MPWPSSAVNSGPRRLSQAHGITETCRNSQPTCSAASCSSPADRPDVQSQVKRMSQNQFSSAMPDLFGAIQLPTHRRSGPARPTSGAARHTPKLHALSDRELAGLLGDLVREVQRRIARDGGRKPAPELERALREAGPVFAETD